MQPTEGFSVQRRALDVEDYIDILRRHKGWIFGPFLLTLVGSVVGAYLWPDSYDSVSLVQIRRQQVSEQMVQSVGNADILDRINVLTNQVMSRSELTTLMRNLNLYPKERTTQPPEQVLQRMKDAIKIQPLGSTVGPRGVPAFSVKFSYPNRFDAQKLVLALVTKFIDEDVKARDSTSFMTKSFIQDQTEQAKKRLDEIEAKITSFRTQNQGRLPDQLNSNMSALQTAQSQMTYLSTSSGRAASERLQYETAIQNAKDQISALTRESQTVATNTKAGKSAKVVSAENTLEQLETQLSVNLKQFTEAHPDVKRVRSMIAIAEQKLAEAQAQEAAQKKDEPAAAAPPINFERAQQIRNFEGQIRQYESAIEIKNKEIADFEKQMKQASDQISVISSRVQAMPVGDQLWGDLVREQVMAKEEYMKMSDNLRKSQVAVDLDNRSQGEKLELLDAANLPEEPTDPNRPMVISMGAALGLVLGVVLAGAREMKDTSLKNLKDVRAYTQMAILGSVPLLENDFVVRRRRRIAWLGWTVACLLSVLIMAGSVVYYYQTKP
ncbi:MAG: GNVR domain-containing protein [Acidobacteriota bacterium]